MQIEAAPALEDDAAGSRVCCGSKPLRGRPTFRTQLGHPHTKARMI
jgi:hypothetical protein